jgi:hypothetical protein
MPWLSLSLTDAILLKFYDLKQMVHQLKQSGGFLEKYYNELQGLWKEINFRRLNPMICVVDIEKHSSWVQENRVYKFLVRLDDRLDSTRADIIQTVSLPTIEQAYARVRREEMRQKVMCGYDNACNPAVMAMKHTNRAQKYMDRTPEVSLSLKSETKQGKKVEGGCNHCHNPKHTNDNCFKLHGYSDWWRDLKEKKAAGNKKEQGDHAHLAGHTDRILGHTDCIEDSTGQTSLTLATHVKGTDKYAEKDNALVAQNLEK